MVFGGSQVLIDIEPGYRMIVGDVVIHGPSHTLGGAAIIGMIATLAGKPISEYVLRAIRYPRPVMTWAAAAMGAFIGTFSHVLLDAIMHADMLPWSPISESNQLLGSMSLASLHLTCAGLGIVSAVIFISMEKKRNAKQTDNV